ncbi:hypothetical protein C8Q74DRAFT_1231405 [Fomes fomentarius]|nr:hypothetical protein C8Q74DRAFT_1231405 [Fomes fomentarius]
MEAALSELGSPTHSPAPGTVDDWDPQMHGTHEDAAPQTQQTQTQARTASFRKPTPLTAPIIAMPSPSTPPPEMPNPMPLSCFYRPPPTTASVTTWVPAQMQVQSPTAGAPPAPVVTGPSRITMPSHDSIPESYQEEQSGTSGQENGAPSRRFSSNTGGRSHASTVGSGNGAGIGSGGGGNGHEHAGGSGGGNYGPTASVRRPARAISYNDTPRQADRYPVPPPKTYTVPTTPIGMGPGSGMAIDLNPEGAMHGGTRRSEASVPTLFSGTGEKSVGERIQPTLDAANKELVRTEARAKYNGWALNVAIGAQVVLGALTTGVAAATTGKQTSIATSILGGLSTLAASYLAKSRGSNEPEESTRKAQDLKSFIRDCEAFKLDCGHVYGQTQDHMINRYRRRFEEILGNGVEGVGDDVKVNKVQKEKPSPA